MQGLPQTTAGKQARPTTAAPASGKGPTLAVSKAAGSSAAKVQAARYRHLSKQQALVLASLAEFLDQSSLNKSLLALANELRSRFRCTRVVVGLYRADTLRLRAISEQSLIDHKSIDSRALLDALTEACEQDSTIHFPLGQKPLQIVHAHRTLCAGREHTEVFTVPLAHHGEMLGALLLQRTSKQPWAPMTTELFRQLAATIAPLIALYAQRERSFTERLSALPRQGLQRMLGQKHLVKKTTTLLLAGLLGTAHFVQASHQVRADGELVSLERRTIVAPVLGYITEVAVRPGDAVAAGDLLVRLDTRDLELEREKWRNQLDSADSEFRAAMASHDRSEMAVAQARQRGARAQLRLVEEQIQRARILAPANGIVISGDLSQSLGAPVERGTELLEIAPELGYEVQLLIDERDIASVHPGQHGRLTLRASPADGAGFTINTIHPVAETAGGRMVFRAEARLDQELAGLRPGQTGIGKISIGERSLLWSWTHRFTDWVRLKYWELVG